MSAHPQFPLMPPMRMTDQRGNAAVTVLAWIAAVFTLFYMLPWAVAATRGKSNHAAIGLLNLLLGWTFVGWIVAFAMACGAHQQVALPFGMTFAPGVAPQSLGPTGPAPGWYTAPDGSGEQQWWDGQRWAAKALPPA